MHGRLPFLALVTLALGAAATPAAAQTCAPPPPDLVSWWPGDGNADDWAQRNSGTAEAGTTYAAGLVREAFHFDGEDDFVNVPDSATLDALTTQMTVELWMRPHRPAYSGWVFSRRDPLESEGFSILVGRDGELMIYLRTTTSPDPSGTAYWSGGVIRFEEWQHVAVAVDTQAGAVEAYVNGSPVPLQAVYGPSLVSGSLFNVDHLFLGRRQSSATVEGEEGAGHYAGELDEVAVFGRKLSRDEIRGLHAAGAAGKCQIAVGIDFEPGFDPNVLNLSARGEVAAAILGAPGVFDVATVDVATVTLAGAAVVRLAHGIPAASFRDVNRDGALDLVALFRMEELQLSGRDTAVLLTATTNDGRPLWGKDTVRVEPSCIPQPAGLTNWWPGDGHAGDVIGGRDAVTKGDATTGAGLVAGSFVLDGDGDYLDVAHHPSLDLGSGDFTLGFWTVFADTHGEQVLAEKWIQRYPGSEGWTLTKLDSGHLRFVMAPGDGSEQEVESCALGIRPGRWLHVAVTRRSGRVRLFVNGSVVAEAISFASLDSPSSLKFGHRGSVTDTPGSESEDDSYLNGRIDEVQMAVGHALTADQIRSIFQAGRAGVCF